MAALLLGGFFGKKEATAAPGPVVNMTEVLVAAKDFDVGHAVTAEDLKWQKWPNDAVAPAFVTKDIDPAGLENMVGSVARTVVFAGEPATSTKLVKAETASFMAAALTPGMRAVSVEISEETGAGGFILPNDRVDLIVTAEVSNSEGSASGIQSRTLLQNVRVLAVGQTFRDSGGEGEGAEKTVSAKTATLEVSPAEAELLQLSARGGRLSLALRGLTGADTPVATVRTPKGGDGQRKANTDITIIRFGSASQVQAAN